MSEDFIERTYEDSVEEYLVVLIRIVEPDYEIWRPYFEVDFQHMADCIDSNDFITKSEGSNKLTELVLRFLSKSVPIWVREQILERIALSTEKVIDKFSEYVIGVVSGILFGGHRDPKYQEALDELKAKSKLARAVFGGVDLRKI